MPQKRVWTHRFPQRYIRYIKAACPLPPPLPKAACPLPPIPETARQWLDQHEEAEEQEAALPAPRPDEKSGAPATGGTEAQEASQARIESETETDRELAEQLAGMDLVSMNDAFERELASQVRRALQIAAVANDFLQRPDPNFLSALCYYVCMTVCVCGCACDSDRRVRPCHPCTHTWLL